MLCFSYMTLSLVERARVTFATSDRTGTASWQLVVVLDRCRGWTLLSASVFSCSSVARYSDSVLLSLVVLLSFGCGCALRARDAC